MNESWTWTWRGTVKGIGKSQDSLSYKETVTYHKGLHIVGASLIIIDDRWHLSSGTRTIENLNDSNRNVRYTSRGETFQAQELLRSFRILEKVMDTARRKFRKVQIPLLSVFWGCYLDKTCLGGAKIWQKTKKGELKAPGDGDHQTSGD